jgi:hypothetical protein
MKYHPLRLYLEAVGAAAVPLSFAEIEEILGVPLPASARRHAAWWSNNPTNHVNAQAWLQAGYASEQVDLRRQQLVFALRSPAPRADASRPGLVERLQARLGGTVRLAAGVDLTQPTGEIWNAEIE